MITASLTESEVCTGNIEVRPSDCLIGREIARSGHQG